jgi:uncharacterized coiled-coil DUF342 family protein
LPEQRQKSLKIDELMDRLSSLKSEKEKLDAETDKCAEERDKLNDQFRIFREQIFELKRARDEINDKVREQKQQRENARAGIRGKVEEIKRLQQEAKVLGRKKPARSLQSLQKEVDAVEWKIQTTSLDLKEERELVGKVKELEVQLVVYRKLEQVNRKKLELQADVRVLNTKVELYHKNLVEAAQKSQEIHEKMLKKVEESKNLKAEADRLHTLFVQAKEKTVPLRKEIAETAALMEQLMSELREHEKRQKEKSEETLREKLESQAREKLRRGEKLTWEEFQLLAEKGIKAQD